MFDSVHDETRGRTKAGHDTDEDVVEGHLIGSRLFLQANEEVRQILERLIVGGWKGAKDPLEFDGLLVRDFTGSCLVRRLELVKFRQNLIVDRFVHHRLG